MGPSVIESNTILEHHPGLKFADRARGGRLVMERRVWSRNVESELAVGRVLPRPGCYLLLLEFALHQRLDGGTQQFTCDQFDDLRLHPLDDALGNRFDQRQVQLRSSRQLDLIR